MYDSSMETIEGPPKGSQPAHLLRRALAVCVMIAAVALLIKLLFHVIVGFFLAVFWVAVAVAAVVALLWALKTLL
jgi:hypothetical protein